MFCPQCGQRQVASDARFCPACGFPLGGVAELLANGGQSSWRPPQAQAAPAGISPRQKGIRQGAMLMLSTLLVVPLLAIFGVMLLELPGEFVALAAIFCTVGGFLRIIYALMFESNVPPAPEGVPAAYVPPPNVPSYLSTPAHSSTKLPPAQSTPVHPYSRPQRLDTGELVEPPRSGVTDHTTRLLDKQPDEPPRQ